MAVSIQKLTIKQCILRYTAFKQTHMCSTDFVIASNSIDIIVHCNCHHCLCVVWDNNVRVYHCSGKDVLDKRDGLCNLRIEPL